MKRYCLLIFLVLFYFIPLYADHVPVDKAREVALNLYYEQSGLERPEIKIIEEIVIKQDETPVYYIFNFSDNRGFVIISAEDHVYPVLGYSFENNYKEDDQPAAFTELIQNYKMQINYVQQNNLSATQKINERWERYLSGDISKTTEKGVEPLLGDIKWNQGEYYNDFCPEHVDGPGGHCPAGCIATATGQIMKYHHHPYMGNGSHSYEHTISNGFANDFGILFADFGNTTYSWQDMPNSLSYPNSDIAQLLFHIGVASEMDYDDEGSGAIMPEAKDALINYFNYKSIAEYIEKLSYTDIEWIDILKEELNNIRPILYAGTGTGGHAFVCDGYNDSDEFHFNWGWGGSYDGYYVLSNLNPGSHNYSIDQNAVIGIEPSTAFVPVSNFSANIGNAICTGSQVQFFDYSSNAPDSWDWLFPGGDPVSSTAENPSVEYNVPGIYYTSLTAFNEAGSGNTEVKVNYIKVYDPAIEACTVNTNLQGNFQYNIYNVTLEDIDNTTDIPFIDNDYHDYTCSHTSVLKPDSQYTVTLTIGKGNPDYDANYYIYIDYNNDGDFEDAGEFIVSGTATQTGQNIISETFTVPGDPVLNTLLRMRIINDQFSVNDACSGLETGQAEDYGIFIQTSNHNPVGGNDTITTTQNAAYKFSDNDFTFSDMDSNSFAGIQITSLPGAGELKYIDNDAYIDLLCEAILHLEFIPDSNTWGIPYTSFSFRIKDISGAFSDSIYTMIINVTETDTPPTVINMITDTTLCNNGTTIIDLTYVFNDIDNSNVSIVKEVSYNSNPELINASISGNTLILSAQTDQVGDVYIVVQAISNGLTADDQFIITLYMAPDPPVVNDDSCFIDQPIPPLVAVGNDIKWYQDSSLDTLVYIGDTFPTGETEAGIYTYYVTQSDGYCESFAAIVHLTILKRFTDITAGLTDIDHSSVAWGDYDNDGDLDILLTGNYYDSVYHYISKIYRNDGNDVFTDISAGLTGVSSSSVAWGDYDNDGDLDILLTGYYKTFEIYRNNNNNDNNNYNNIPDIPTGLTSQVIENNVILNWNKATDAETLQDGLTYNLMIGTDTNPVQIMSPMADETAGYRRVVQLGNTNHNTSWEINNLSIGTYYWSVQAIDNCFAGSPFATVESFDILTVGIEEGIDDSGNISIYPNPNDGVFNIEIENVRSDVNIEISDITGKTVYLKDIHKSGHSDRITETLDISEFLQGVYFVKVKSEEYNKTLKLFKY